MTATVRTVNPMAYVREAGEALMCAENLARPNSSDSVLVNTALGRLRMYGDKVAASPLGDVTQGWLLPAVEAVATEARSVRVRREGLRAVEALVRAERAAVFAQKEV